MAPLLNYTTTIAADRTVGEMSKILARAGATGIYTEWDGGQPIGIAFELPTPRGVRAFQLPVDHKAAHAALQRCVRAGEVPPRYANLEQARKVAWRIVREWLLVQLALVQADMATLDQVMLPYLRVSPTTTLYDAYRAGDGPLPLPAAE